MRFAREDLILVDITLREILERETSTSVRSVVGQDVPIVAYRLRGDGRNLRNDSRSFRIKEA